MNNTLAGSKGLSRRDFLRHAALGSAVLASGALLGCATKPPRKEKGPTQIVHYLDKDWRFGGEYADGMLQPDYDDKAFATVCLPHCVTKQSWQDWDPAAWEKIWIYRRRFFTPPALRDHRIFLDFDGVMVSATPMLNGHPLPKHSGGYLPFSYEITDLMADNENLLAVAVDSRWTDVPPEGNPKGPTSLDFSEVGGIHRRVKLRAVPQVYISDVFAKPVDVLKAGRRIEVSGKIDAALTPGGAVRVQVDLYDGEARVATASTDLEVIRPSVVEWNLALTDLEKLKLWDVDSPQLYEVVATLHLNEEPWHDYRTRVGLREARFELDGFFLNGRRLQLFGLCRHEIYPYVGFAMPDRVMRQDAHILKHELNCNSVRCSHYPQTEAFLDACDELGLLVWEEIPGWGYLGDAPWKEQAVKDVKAMVLRDRNHPSIVIWGVRINESKNEPELYRKTTAMMRSLDDSRPASGAIVGGMHSTKGWNEDVFAYNDYKHDLKTGDVTLDPPLPGVPYILTEAVGQLVGVGPSTAHIYRRTGSPALQEKQAIYHAQAHDQAAANPRFGGVIAWCAFEYASPVSVAWHGIKYPGVYDVFRLEKLGASFYQAQVPPQVRPVIQPNFYWDFGPQSPEGPGKQAAIFSNCERLKVYIDGKHQATLTPDRARFPHVAYAPFFLDLELDGAHHPELRIEGYIGGHHALTRSFSSDPTHDRIMVQADAPELNGDGVDAGRVWFKVTDKFGAARPFATGTMAFEITGPGVVVGDNPFSLTDSGGVGAIWIKTLPDSKGVIALKATHSTLGAKLLEIKIKPV